MRSCVRLSIGDEVRIVRCDMPSTSMLFHIYSPLVGRVGQVKDITQDDRGVIYVIELPNRTYQYQFYRNELRLIK